MISNSKAPGTEILGERGCTQCDTTLVLITKLEAFFADALSHQVNA